MGFTRERTGLDGKVRYQALYDDVKGRRRSAGTFASAERAERAWRRAEDKLSEGRLVDGRLGRQRFGLWVEGEWLPKHEMEARTRENYTYYLKRHIMPYFESMRMVAILPGDVRDWVSELKAADVSPQVTRYCMTVLSAIFTTALVDKVVALHPCMGVKTPTVPKKLRRILTPEQFDRIYNALPSDSMQLLAEVDIETGLRWGELTELRPKDFELPGRLLTVTRVVVELVREFHPTGDRFLVREYPKDGESRSFKVSTQLSAKIERHIEKGKLSDDDLLFSMPELPTRKERVLAGPETLGLTEPNEHGRQYEHGTLSAYSAAKCRCDHCRHAYAAYRAQRRADGKDQPRNRPKPVDTDGHIPRRWFRDHIWQPAVKSAAMNRPVLARDLRHAHASWLLAGGADLQVVKERLGHASIVTTEKYLHTLDGEDETALDALAKIRNRASKAANG